jgi:SAM-dependent methyltransferase
MRLWQFSALHERGGIFRIWIEPSESSSQFAREEHVIEIHHGMIEGYLAAHGARKFDVITLLNVFEDLTHPAQTLLQLRQILAPDGLLAIVVADARFHDLLGRLRRHVGLQDAYWLEQPLSFLSGFKLSDHLCSFQARTIASLLQRCGFRVVAFRNAPLVFNSHLHRICREIFGSLGLPGCLLPYFSARLGGLLHTGAGPKRAKLTSLAEDGYDGLRQALHRRSHNDS